MEIGKQLKLETFLAVLVLSGVVATGVRLAGGAGQKAPEPSRFERLVAEARKNAAEITPAALRERLKSPGLVLIDVREEREWRAGRIPGAVHLSRGVLERRIEAQAPQADAEIVLYCASGARSALAAESLKRMGYSNVFSLKGGYAAWLAEGARS